VALLLCGCFMVYESRNAAFATWRRAPSGDMPYWPGFIWMSAGLLANAALITTIGFILSCALCFVLAAARVAQGGGATGRRPETVADRRHYRAC